MNTSAAVEAFADLGDPPHFATPGEQDALAEGGPSYASLRPKCSGAASEELSMNSNRLIRQIHRWLSIAFTVAVIINIAAMGQEQPAVWVGLLALFPLILLLLSGLYLFVLPYTVKGRSAEPARHRG